MAEITLIIVVEVVKCLAPPAYRHISYLRESKYTSNLQNLKTEAENLKSERVSTQHQVDEAKRKGEEIEENVVNWLAGANNIIVKADKFTDDEATAKKRCFKGLCPNLKARHQLSKEAVRLKEAIVKVREARRFDRVSFRTAPEDIRLISSKDYEAFESRMPTLRNIHCALEDPDVNMVGIYGMGGIGKTMLAEEVARKVKGDKLFDQVVFIEVSQSPDTRKIQGEIADKLGLKFHEESEPGRANSLFKRIKEEKTIFIILDNIWENLDLRATGIPHGEDHKGCKILLTARSEDTLSRKMESRPNFSIGVLNDEEAWSLFKKMTGDYIEGSEFKWIATGVAKECAGLPVSIVTVARALRNNKSLFDWKDALEQLRRPSLKNFMNIQPTAYKAIKLSYDNLGGDELKNIFLLTGYTAIASIDDLLMYAMGLGLFQGVNKVEVARARVHALVRKLKASCMLLDHISNNEEFFSMHDVVRDVAVSIACREQNVFSATDEQVDGCREWSDESAVKLYTSIVLRDIKTNLLPEVVKCPQLKLFFIHAEKESSSLTIPNKFFERMMQVRVINLTYMNLQSLPSSLGLLLNLRTLSLCYCKLLDVSVIGNLKELEILCLRGSGIKRLPVEVGQLSWLKLLDLRDCSKLEVIPPNILSNLSHLEELNIGDNSFDKWDVEVDGVKNASLDELKHLTSLELQIKDVNSLPRGLFFEKLERYRILIGDFWNWKYNICSRDFRIELNSKTCLKDGLIVQLQGIEHLGLYGLQEQDVQNFVNELLKVGSSQLKHLWIEGCRDAINPAESKRWEKSANNMRSNDIILEDNINISSTLEKAALPKLETLELYSINIERIWPNQIVAMSCGIQNLTCLKMYNCRNLRYLFSSSMVSNNSFVRLQHLEIRECPVLEELIVMDDQEESKNNKSVMFPQLEYLNMNGLGEFKSFYTGDLHIEFPSLKQLKIANCPKLMVKYKSTAHDLIEKSNEIILEDNVSIPKTLFTEKVVLPNLEILKLYDLNVERIWKSHHTTMYCGVQNLTHLTIYDCRNLRCMLFTSYIVSSFVKLQHLEIIKCPGLEEIVVVDEQEDSNYKIVMFPQLQYLGMKDLEKLTRFCTGDFHIEFPSLKELRILRCPKFMVKYKSTSHELTEKVFGNLVELRVDAKHVATNNRVFPEDLLYKLKCVDVEFDDESTTILSLDDFLHRFHTMKVLRIEGGLNNSLSEEKDENGMEVIIRDVNKCCYLKHFLKQESSTMDNLEWLTISNCNHLINLVPSSSSFQNLATLVVSHCKGLKNVLTSSTANTLVRLREMRISECNMMKKIVADDDDAAKDEIIIFSELKELKLWDLKSLTSFCSGNCAFKFPHLEMLLVDNCSNMKIFSGGELSTPKLHKVHLSSWNEELWIWEHDLNTTIQQLYLKKRREFLRSQQFPPSAPARNLNIQTKLYSLPSMVAGVWSDDNSLQLEATTQFIKLLSVERSPQIEEVIQSGVVPRFVEFLMWEDYPQLQYEAAWALTNIASGTSENTKVVIDYGAVPIFVKLLASPSDDVREQAAWALGNVAGDSPICRDLVLSEEALIPLLELLNEHAKLSMLRRATWTLSNFCRGKPQPPFDQVRSAFPVLAQLVHSNDEEVLTDACRALSDLSNGTNDKIQAVIEAHVCPRLVELLGHPSPSVLTLALRTIGNITAGDDFQTKYIINCGALPCLLGLLIHNHKKSIKKDACWTISNITAGNRELIQAVIDAGLIGPLVNLVQNAEFDIKQEAAWAISNATSIGTNEQIKYLVREGCVKPLCDLFLCPDPRIVTVCRKGLENILKVGEAEKNKGSTIRDVNQYSQLDNLQSNDNNDISEKAVEILKAYSVQGMRFKDEEEDPQGQGDN